MGLEKGENWKHRLFTSVELSGAQLFIHINSIYLSREKLSIYRTWWLD